MSLHKNLTAADNHIIHALVYADDAARTGATGLVAEDVGKAALQLNDKSYWILSNHSPVTWLWLAGTGNLPHHRGTHAGEEADDVIPSATQMYSGLMSAADKIALDNVVSGGLTLTVRNETGTELLKGRAVAVIGWNASLHVELVDYADKDTASRRPAAGVLQANLPSGTSALAMVAGKIEGLNTSSLALTDQLVLGNSGNLVRPPPDNTPFTGEIQNLASVTKVDTVDGHIVVAIDGLTPVTAAQIFALAGTSGTPGPANKYVTDADARLLFGNNKQYVVSEDVSSTTSSTFQDKTTLTTAALTGVYRVAFYAEMASSSTTKHWQLRLYNSTDAAELCNFQCIPYQASVYSGENGFAEITFTGAAKTFKIQYASDPNNPIPTAYIRRARIHLWRVG